MAITANDNQDISEVSSVQIDELLALLDMTGYEPKMKLELVFKISAMTCMDEYDFLKSQLQANQIGFDSAVNPGQREINAHLRRLVKHPNK